MKIRVMLTVIKQKLFEEINIKEKNNLSQCVYDK